MKLSVIVPCYNEEQNVEAFFNEATKSLKKLKNDYELIFINDGSKDNTYNELKKLWEANKNYNIKVINFSRNFGKEAGMYAGLKESVGEYVSIIDADLQQKPEIILDMIDILDKNAEYDSVACYQEKRKEGAVLTFFKNRFYGLINKVVDSNIKFVSGASDFRTFRRPVIDSILEMPEYYRFSKGIFSWVGYNTYFMPYKVEKRNAGKSTWSFKSLFKYAISGIISFSNAPLKLATRLGILSVLASFIYCIVVLIQKLGCSMIIPVYAPIIILILFIGGIQLLILGIIGEYLARTYTEVRRRPIYIAKNILDYKKTK